MKATVHERRTLSDMIAGLENGTINPRKLDKGTLKEFIYNAKDMYSSSELGHLLKMSQRNVQRYLKDVREDNALTTSIDFQRGFIWDVVNNLRSQYYRLVRISYAEDVSNYEKIRAIFAACQVQKDAIAIMEKFGYLSRQRLEEAEVKLLTSEWNPSDDPLVCMADKLLPAQREKLVDFIKSEPGYTEDRLLKMAKLFIGENKKAGLYDTSGNLQIDKPVN